MSGKSINPKTFENAAETERIGNRGVHEAQEENRRLGLPNVYSHNGKLYYELPDGTITTESPFQKKDGDAK